MTRHLLYVCLIDTIGRAVHLHLRAGALVDLWGVSMTPPPDSELLTEDCYVTELGRTLLTHPVKLIRKHQQVCKAR